MEYFDCSVCEKDHESDPAIGDIHYDRASGRSYLYDGSLWTEYRPLSTITAPSTWTTTGIGSWTTTGTGPLGPTTPHLPLYPEPSEYKFSDVPNDSRRTFIAHAIEKHTVDWDIVRCTCGISFFIDDKTDKKDIEWGYSLHIADIAVAASDEWDELQMAGDDEQDQKHSDYDDLA